MKQPDGILIIDTRDPLFCEGLKISPCSGLRPNGIGDKDIAGMSNVAPLHYQGLPSRNEWIGRTDGRAEWTVIAQYPSGRRFEEQLRMAGS